MAPSVIRKATVEDVGTLAQLFRQEVELQQRLAGYYALQPAFDWESFMRRLIARNTSAFFIAVQGGQILGFIHVRATSTGVPQSIGSRLRRLCRGKVAHPHGPVKPFVLGVIEDCFVNFGSRRQGIGTSLLDRAMTWFHEKGMERVELAALANNEDGEKFWVKHGFRTYRLLMSKQSP